MRVLIAVCAVVHHLLQYLVPVRDSQVAWTSYPDYGGNAFHLYRHMLATRAGLRHCWLVEDLAVRQRILDDLATWSGDIRPNTVSVVARHSPRGYWTFLRSRQVFHTQGVYRWVRTAVGRDCVSLWHGMPLKAIEALDPVASRPVPAFGTLHLAASETYRQIMARAFRTRVEDVLLTTLPRCDVLTRASPLAPRDQDIREALGVPEGERLVLWMPTFRTPANFRIRPPGMVGFRTFLDDVPGHTWRELDEQAGRARCHVVLKLHPWDALQDTEFDPQRAWGLEHVRLVRSPEWDRLRMDLYDVLAVTDGLVTDLSSVMLDWLLTARPLGMIGYDPDTYVRGLLVDLRRIAGSDRVHDLADPAALRNFFTHLAEDRGVDEDPDLTDWLCRTDLGSGCEAVLAAVGR